MGSEYTRQVVDSRNPGPALPAMFDRYKDRIGQELSRVVPAPHNTDLYVILRYHLGWVDRYGKLDETSASQGKALRPTLCMFACEALDGDPLRALPAAAALELIHNFSLLHDDIQDQDTERRHHPTAWYLWGTPQALVAGDAMQAVGDLALLSSVRQDVPAETTLKVSRLLTESYLEMIEGQCLDLGFEPRTNITTDDYLHMIACKTGALIRSAMEIGALLATNDDRVTTAFSRFGSSLGRAFQIRDDFLGIWGDEDTTGKPAGNDIRRRKKSFPIVFALERAAGPARDDLWRIYQQETLNEVDVARVLDVLDEVGAPAYSQQLTEESAEGAIQALETVTLPAWARTEVEELVEFLARRLF